MRYHEVKGHWPLMKAKKQNPEESDAHSAGSSGNGTAETKPVVTERMTEA
jgi:hypothetical protein